MTDDRTFLLLATFAYLISSGYVCYAFGAKRLHKSHFNLVVMSIGFAFHTAFLHFRGQTIGHCPLTNLFEVTAFITWSIVLNYLVIGPVFRLSLLGAFTAPLVTLLNFFALACPHFDRPRAIPHMSWILEAHAALSAMAYGTLGLSAVAAAMFLVSNHYLKTRALPPIVFRLPALGKLDAVNQKVGLLGFAMLTVGMMFGFFVRDVPLDTVKVAWSVAVWAVYAFMLAGRYLSRVSPVRFAWLSLLTYLFVLLTFWAVNSLSRSHHFGA